MRMWTSGGDLELVHPRVLPDLIAKEPVYQQVQQFAVPNPSAFAGPIGSSSPTSTVVSYSRNVKTIDYYTNLEDFILTSFVGDLHKGGRIVDTKPKSFEEAIEDASVACVENFGFPTHAAVFGDNVIIVGGFDKDAICFKEAAPNYGALLTYTPGKFAIIHSPEPCQFIKVEQKYNKYVSNVLIFETLRKLGLS